MGLGLGLGELRIGGGTWTAQALKRSALPLMLTKLLYCVSARQAVVSLQDLLYLDHTCNSPVSRHDKSSTIPFLISFNSGRGGTHSRQD